MGVVEELASMWTVFVQDMHVPVVDRSAIALAGDDRLFIPGGSRNGCSLGNVPAPPGTHGAEAARGVNPNRPDETPSPCWPANDVA